VDLPRLCGRPTRVGGRHHYLGMQPRRPRLTERKVPGVWVSAFSACAPGRINLHTDPSGVTTGTVGQWRLKTTGWLICFTSSALGLMRSFLLHRKRSTSAIRAWAPYGLGAPIYGPPGVVAPPPPTDAQVLAGTILGIAGLAIDASMYRRH
jgi:hypothetical protein